MKNKRLLRLDARFFCDVELQRKIFLPYFTTKSRGTGLGLAVVKKIADEHGARIELGNRYAESVFDAQVGTLSSDNLTPQVVGAQVSLSFSVV